MPNELYNELRNVITNKLDDTKNVSADDALATYAELAEFCEDAANALRSDGIEDSE